MTWFKKEDEGEKEMKERREELKLSDELWIKCNSCNEMIYRKVIERIYRSARNAIIISRFLRRNGLNGLWIRIVSWNWIVTLFPRSAGVQGYQAISGTNQGCPGGDRTPGRRDLRRGSESRANPSC